jgi:hypothetical protein
MGKLWLVKIEHSDGQLLFFRLIGLYNSLATLGFFFVLIDLLSFQMQLK